MALTPRAVVSIVAVVALVEIAFAVFLFRSTKPAASASVAAESVPATAIISGPAAGPASSPAAAVASTIVAPQAAAPRPKGAPVAVDGVAGALTELLGAKAVQAWLRRDDFPRRLVATIDNLGRDHAPSSLWPVVAAEGHFSIVTYQGRTVIDPDNQLRYVPFVQWVEQIDSVNLVAMYVRLLPVLQRAYEDIGFPNRRFDERLLSVIDGLLGAPNAPEFVDVKFTQVKGPVPSLRPWLRYEFADARLEAASAGQKLMMRIGAPNEARLKAKLRELRGEIVRQAIE